MKTTRFIMMVILVSMGYAVLSQNSILPGIDVFTLEGSRISASNIQSNDQAVVIVFWNSDDMRSLDQVRMINEEFKNSLKMKNVKVVGICSDCSGSLERLRPLVNAIDLDFEVYIDRNNALKRAMSIPGLPYTMVIDQSNHVFEYLGYCMNAGELITNAIEKSLARNDNSR
jgi:hypothetical protein